MDEKKVVAACGHAVVETERCSRDATPAEMAVVRNWWKGKCCCRDVPNMPNGLPVVLNIVAERSQWLDQEE
jgi:hypothetical protein